MKNIFTFLLLLCLVKTALSQDLPYTIESHYHDYKVGEQLILSKDSSIAIPYSQRGHLLFKPKKGETNGTIIFIMGGRIDATMQLYEFELIEPAIKNQLAVAFVSTGNLVDFLFTNKQLSSLDSLVWDTLYKNKLENKPFVLAGLSLAGTRAMKYAEYCLQHQSSFFLKQ